MPLALKSLMVSGDTTDRREAVMCLLRWFAPAFVFFSLISTKAPAYVLPVLPPFCVLLAATWLSVDGRARPAAQTQPAGTRAESTEPHAESTGTLAASIETREEPTQTAAARAGASVCGISSRMLVLVAKTPPAAVTAVVSLLVAIALTLYRD